MLFTAKSSWLKVVVTVTMEQLDAWLGNKNPVTLVIYPKAEIETCTP